MRKPLDGGPAPRAAAVFSAEGCVVSRTKKSKASPIPQTEPAPANVNGPPSDVLTLAEAAVYLRLPETQVIGLVHLQGLPARFTGSEWRFLRAALQERMRTGSPPQGGSKE